MGAVPVRTRHVTLGCLALAVLLTACSGPASSPSSSPTTAASASAGRSSQAATTPSAERVPAPFRDPLPGMPTSDPCLLYTSDAADE